MDYDLCLKEGAAKKIRTILVKDLEYILYLRGRYGSGSVLINLAEDVVDELLSHG
jgi:hypothetical protein